MAAPRGMKAGFSQSTARAGVALHAAAHSHHPWPDVSLAAQEQAWRDAAALLDRKWEKIFAEVIPAAQAHIARELKLPDPVAIAFGPNTHSFVLRILSCLPAGRPLRVLTTDSEFMSFARQMMRLEEDGLVRVTRIATTPFDNFETRSALAAAKDDYDLVYFSQVFFDSAYVVRDLATIVKAVKNRDTFVVIDGYHGFMAVPADLSAVANRAFYLAGGYKYAMAGEGVCFLHCPPGYGARPRDTGWYAGFAALESGRAGVRYAAGGGRFFGATFDVSGLYRFNAVQDWLAGEGLTTASMLVYVRGIERVFLAEIARTRGPLAPDMLMIVDENRRGRFLTFRTADAARITEALEAKNVIVDYRRDRLRIGFGIYHDADDARRLAATLAGLSL